MKKIIVIEEKTNKRIWVDDCFGWESMDKAEMAITYHGYCERNRETAYDGNILIWVYKP